MGYLAVTSRDTCVTIVPVCVVMLEGHGMAGMAGTYVVVSGHRYRMFGCIWWSRDVFAATDGGARAGHEVVSQSCIGRSSERMY